MKKLLIGLALFLLSVTPAYADKSLDIFIAKPPIHIKEARQQPLTSPQGLTPSQVKAAYKLSGGGSGTVAIIDAYDYPSAESDLGVFSAQFSLPPCTTANGCFEKHPMTNRIRSNNGWGLEAALDTQWAHAIAPNAKILLVEARSASGTDLLNAVNYARNRSDVVAISMSWGGNEFAGESTYDSYFTSPTGATFFASSGDSGAGVSWPAVSPNVVGVGGTNLTMNGATFISETAWSGSGGGLSAYQSEPSYQTAFNVPNANGKRAVPDVSYAGGPNPGFPVYDTTGYSGWVTVYGTSAGSPQWAAIKALGGTASNTRFYADALGSYISFFRDIISGTNGNCATYCTAGTGYDYITGLGSPLTAAY